MEMRVMDPRTKARGLVYGARVNNKDPHIHQRFGKLL